MTKPIAAKKDRMTEKEIEQAVALYAQGKHPDDILAVINAAEQRKRQKVTVNMLRYALQKAGVYTPIKRERRRAPTGEPWSKNPLLTAKDNPTMKKHANISLRVSVS